MEIQTEIERLKKENRILRAKFDLAVKQRDATLQHLNQVSKIPFKERQELLDDYNADLEKLNE